MLPASTGPLVVPVLSRADVRLSLVVPTYNESENIREFLGAVRTVLDRGIGGAYEVIVVDDDSPDRTWQIAAEVAVNWPALRVIRRQNERGLASAVIRGWQAARGEILGTINADFQHPADVLAGMIERARESAVVVASRFCREGSVGNWQWLRRMGSKGAQLLGVLLIPATFRRTTDPLSGCYLFRRSTVAGIELRPLGYKTLMEILARGHASTVADCGYTMSRRLRGESKVGAAHWLLYIRHLFRLRAAVKRQTR